jgi:hypothetical protein
MMTAVCATVSELSTRIGSFGHKLCMDSYFFLIYLTLYKGHKFAVVL